MTQRDQAMTVPSNNESEVEHRYAALLGQLESLLPEHAELLDELDAVVSELLAEADDRARASAPNPLSRSDRQQDDLRQAVGEGPASGPCRPITWADRRRGGHR